MGKKRKRTDRRARKGGAANTNRSADELLREMQEWARQGRLRRAAGIAKVLAKHADCGPEHLRAVVDVHQGRVEEALRTGDRREAAALFESLVAAHPDWQSLWGEDFSIRIQLQGLGTDRIESHSRDPEATTRVDEVIRTRLRDLRGLAEHPGLAPTHLLRAAAAEVLSAWREVEDGAGDGSAFAAMRRGIGRRSPFLPWRLWVEALAAYYANDDARAAACLERIPADAPVAPMVDALRQVLRGETPESSAGLEVAHATRGPSLAGDLEHVEQLLDEDRDQAALKRMNQVLRGPACAGRPGLRIELGGEFIVLLAEKDSPAHAGMRNPLGAPEELNEIILRAMSRMGADSAFDWEEVHLMGGKRLPPLERALVWNHIAQLHVESASNPHAWMDMDEDEYGLDSDPADLAPTCWRNSLNCVPLRETFQAWHAFTQGRGGDGKDAESLLEAWHEAFPNDEVPLLELVHSCRRRGVFTKANRFFRQAETIARGNPAVEAVRDYLALDRAATYCAQGKPDKVRQTLQGLSAQPPPDAAVVRETLLWAADGASPDEAPALVDLENPFGVALACEHLAARGFKPRAGPLDPPWHVQAQYADTDRMVRGFHAATRVRDPLWGLPMESSALSLLRDPFLETTVDSSLLRECLEWLTRGQADRSWELDREDLLWALTASGIRRRDAHAAVFLAYRAMLLGRTTDVMLAMFQDRTPRDAKRIDECLAAAYSIAAAHGREDDLSLVLDMAHRFGYRDPEPAAERLTADRLEKIVRREAGKTKPAGPTPRRRPPRRSSRRKTSASDALDDLVTQLDLF